MLTYQGAERLPSYKYPGKRGTNLGMRSGGGGGPDSSRAKALGTLQGAGTAPKGWWEVGGTGRASGSVGIWPNLIARASVSLSLNWAPGPPFLATILTAVPCPHPATLSIFLSRGLTPAMKGAP